MKDFIGTTGEWGGKNSVTVAKLLAGEKTFGIEEAKLNEQHYKSLIDELEVIRQQLRQLRIELRRHRRPVVPDTTPERKQLLALVGEFCGAEPGDVEGSVICRVENVSVSEVAERLFPGTSSETWRRREIARSLRLLGYQKYRTSAEGRKERWRLRG